MRRYLIVFASIALATFALASCAGYSRAESSAATVDVRVTVNRRVELTLDEPVKVKVDAERGYNQVTFSVKGTIRANTNWVLIAVAQDPFGTDDAGVEPSPILVSPSAELAINMLPPDDTLGAMVVLERGLPTPGYTFEHEFKLSRPMSVNDHLAAAPSGVHYLVMPVE